MTKNFKDLVQYAAIAAPIYAQDIKLIPNDSNWNNLTKLTFGGIISGAISLIMLVVALVFFFILIWGGLKWVMSEGDQKAVKTPCPNHQRSYWFGHRLRRLCYYEANRNRLWYPITFRIQSSFVPINEICFKLKTRHPAGFCLTIKIPIKTYFLRFLQF
jgi:hypothetical protein